MGFMVTIECTDVAGILVELDNGDGGVHLLPMATAPGGQGVILPAGDYAVEMTVKGREPGSTFTCTVTGKNGGSTSGTFTVPYSGRGFFTCGFGIDATGNVL